MWRNFKISTKLLLGFGVLLLVFIASVSVTKRYIDVVMDSGVEIVDKVSPAVRSSVELDLQFNAILLAMRGVEFRESKDSMEEYKTEMSKYLKMQDAIAAMHAKEPTLVSPRIVVEKVIPVTKEYVNLVDTVMALTEKKATQFQALRKAGQDISAALAEIQAILHSRAKDSVRNLSGGAEAEVYVDALNAGATLVTDAMALRRDVWRAVANNDLDEMKDLDRRTGKLQSNAEALRRVFDSPEWEKAFEQVTKSCKDYEIFLKDFINTYVELDTQHKNRAPLRSALDKSTSEAADTALQRIDTLLKSNISNLSYSLFMMFASTGAAIVLGIAGALFISRSIANPLKTIVTLAKRSGDGDLTIGKEDFQYDSKDEMGQMVTALAGMIGTQEAMIRRVVEISVDLGNGAANLSAISEETNAAMEEIKASISEISTLSETNGTALEQSNAGVEEMSAGADTVAQSATDSAAFIAQTTHASNKAINTVNNVISGMRDVDKNAKESEAKIRQLVSSVENVNSFVSVITGIADQTNLLALNAAIEAARAGEVGRGFAVVAEEVRKLAEESARAAQSVNGIIKELQFGAQESITATTEAGRLLDKTLEHAEFAVSELNEALQEMNKANDSIQNIAAVAEQQSASSREVALSIDNATKSSIEMVDTVANIQHASGETAQATQGVAEQAEAMAENAKSLTELLGHFKLRSAKDKGQNGLAYSN